MLHWSDVDVVSSQSTAKNTSLDSVLYLTVRRWNWGTMRTHFMIPKARRILSSNVHVERSPKHSTISFLMCDEQCPNVFHSRLRLAVARFQSLFSRDNVIRSSPHSICVTSLQYHASFPHPLSVPQRRLVLFAVCGTVLSLRLSATELVDCIRERGTHTEGYRRCGEMRNQTQQKSLKKCAHFLILRTFQTMLYTFYTGKILHIPNSNTQHQLIRCHQAPA